MSAAITAVTFDFWNTLARVPAGKGVMTEARLQAVTAACEECGIEVEAERLTGLLEEVARSYERSWEGGRHFHPREGVAMLVAELGVEGAAEETIGEAFLGAGRSVELGLAPDVGACLETLAARGVRIGIVCDVGFSGGELLREFLAGAGVLDHFSGWAFSDEVGHYKPSPEIFAAALGALDAAPGEALHVGDLRRTDVAGAAAYGMRTVRYRALHDDSGAEAEPEADFVIDSHLELPPLLDRLASPY
ncbi:MAG: HAD family hydrolase [Solirubrobacterales bacterium]